MSDMSAPLKSIEPGGDLAATMRRIGAEARAAARIISLASTAQKNEALLKVLCHNICCLMQSMYELNLRPKSWKEVA